MTLKIDSSIANQKFTQKFFGVSKNLDNDIIFLGRNMENYNNENLFNFKYNINSNIIEPSYVPFINYNLKEKTFICFKKNIEYILPDFNRQNPEVIFYVKHKNKTEKVKYKINPSTFSQGIKNFENNSKYNLKNTPNFVIPDSVPESIIQETSQINITNHDNNKITINNENNNNNINDINIKIAGSMNE